MKQIPWLLVCLALLVSCPGSYDQPLDSSSRDNVNWPGDSYNPWVDGPGSDGAQAPDQSWPDTTAPDWFPWPKDTYSGSPFGCQHDSDCFGLKCCPTPWGVKLCAEICQR